MFYDIIGADICQVFVCNTRDFVVSYIYVNFRYRNTESRGMDCLMSASKTVKGVKS